MKGGVLLRSLLVIAIFLVASLGAEAASAACTYSSLSQSRPTYVRYKNGYTLGVQSAYYRGNPTAHLWQNGKYQGQYYIPLTLFNGQVVITTRGKWVFETRNGRVRQVWKLVPSVGVCASGWRIIPAY